MNNAKKSNERMKQINIIGYPKNVIKQLSNKQNNISSKVI